MAKRSKRLRNAIESYKVEIEKHFEKLEKDIMEKDDFLARYHIKEIDKSLVITLENKIKLLGESAEDKKLIENYRNRLKEFKRKLGIE
ncbi:hypothetical protein J4408_01935 [Candidatus Pacearchaeota archaeon]|nr:hypothetical protein [Candidatus Pacearchaeota archaeon]